LLLIAVELYEKNNFFFFKFDLIRNEEYLLLFTFE